MFAASRVRSSDHLQMLNFQPGLLLKPTNSVTEQCSTSLGEPKQDLSCCRYKHVTDDKFFEVRQKQQDYDIDDEEFYFPKEQTDNMIYSYFEVPKQVVPLELSVLYNQLVQHESEIAKVPSDLIGEKMHKMLQSLKKDNPQNEFSKSRNDLVDTLLSDSKKSDVIIFINIIWYHSFQFMERHLIENSGDVVVDMTRESFTKVTGKVHQLLGSECYLGYVSGLFDETIVLPVHKSIASQLAIDVHLMFLQHLFTVVKKDALDEPVIIDVEEMDACGKAKIRHVGGWVIRKLLEKSRKYVQTNIFTENSETLESVVNHNKICEIIENALVIPFTKLEDDSLFPETLQVTENLQYRSRCLIHITDLAYQFFLALEQQRVLLLNGAKLKTQKEWMVEMACEELLKNEAVAKWLDCFGTHDLSTNKSGANSIWLLHEVVQMLLQAQFL